MLELLNQLDGFDTRGDVKVIMATNKIETLDPALIRPGRIDRKIEFPLPDIKTKRHIFKLHTSRMQLNEDVDLEEFIMAKDDLSGADIKAVCTEAGLLALRERRFNVSKADFTTARERVRGLTCSRFRGGSLTIMRLYCRCCTRRMRAHRRDSTYDILLYFSHYAMHTLLLLHPELHLIFRAAIYVCVPDYEALCLIPPSAASTYNSNRHAQADPCLRTLSVIMADHYRIHPTTRQ